MNNDRSTPDYCNITPSFKFDTRERDEKRAQDQLRRDLIMNSSPRALEKAEQIGDIVRSGIQELQISAYRPRVQKDDLETMRERTIEFMQRKLDARQLPTMEGLAAWFGISRNTMNVWKNDRSNEKVYEFLNLVSEIFSAMWAESAQIGSTNSVAWIFYAKNHFNYVDKKEVNFNANTDNADAPNADDIRKRWLLENGKDVNQNEGEDK